MARRAQPVLVPAVRPAAAVEITGNEPDNYICYGIKYPGGSELIRWRRVVVTPDQVSGRIAHFVVIEVKVGNATPNDVQCAFLDCVAATSGVSVVVYSVEDAERALV